MTMPADGLRPFADVDSDHVSYRAIVQVGIEEETLTLDLPRWMDTCDIIHEFQKETQDVYGVRGHVLTVDVM